GGGGEGEAATRPSRLLPAAALCPGQALVEQSRRELENGGIGRGRDGSGARLDLQLGQYPCVIGVARRLAVEEKRLVENALHGPGHESAVRSVAGEGEVDAIVRLAGVRSVGIRVQHRRLAAVQ